MLTSDLHENEWWYCKKNKIIYKSWGFIAYNLRWTLPCLKKVYQIAFSEEETKFSEMIWKLFILNQLIYTYNLNVYIADSLSTCINNYMF